LVVKAAATTASEKGIKSSEKSTGEKEIVIILLFYSL
jgi:hypothetical protein